MSKLSEFFAAPPETVPVQIFMVGGGGSGYDSGLRVNGGSGAVYIGTLDLVSEQQLTFTLGARSLYESLVRGGPSILSFTDPITEQEVIITAPGGGSGTSSGVFYNNLNPIDNDDIQTNIRPNSLLDGGCSAWWAGSRGGFGNCIINGEASGPAYIGRAYAPKGGSLNDLTSMDFQVYEQPVMGGKVYGVQGLMLTSEEGTQDLGFVGCNVNITLANTDNSFSPSYLIYSPKIRPLENTFRKSFVYNYDDAVLRGKGGYAREDDFGGDATGGAILFAYPSSVGVATFGNTSPNVSTTIVNNPSNGLTVMEQALIGLSNDTFVGTFTAPTF